MFFQHVQGVSPVASNHAQLQRVKEINQPFELDASVPRLFKIGGSGRSSFMREAIVKLFKNASGWSCYDNDFIGSIVETLLPMLLGIKIIPPIFVSFSSDCKTFVACLHVTHPSSKFALM